MSQDKSKQPANAGNLANTGNASNPGPAQDDMNAGDKNNLQAKQAEKYLRESAPVEDYPDATDMEEAEKTMGKKEKD